MNRVVRSLIIAGLAGLFAGHAIAQEVGKAGSPGDAAPAPAAPDKMPAPIYVFGVGMLGAIAPEILRGYNLRSQPNFTWSWSYVGISIAFAILGGFMPLILPQTTLWGAFYTGLSTPIIVNTALKTAAGPAQVAVETPPTPNKAAVLFSDQPSRWRTFLNSL